MSGDVRAPCRVLRAAHDSGPRQAGSIDLVVLHSAEGLSAAGVAAYFARPSTQASTHLAVDTKECWRMLPDLVIPWGAPGANSDGLHVELCGFAGWTTPEWLARAAMLERAAFKVAKWAWQYKIPRRYLTPAELVAGKRGITTHVDVNAAFHKSNHWDPGPHFPRADFLARVQRHYHTLEAERVK